MSTFNLIRKVHFIVINAITDQYIMSLRLTADFNLAW